MQQALALAQGYDRKDSREVNQGGPVNACKSWILQLCLELFHCASHDVSGTLSMNAHVITCSIDPIDIIVGNQQGLLAVPDGEFILHELRAATDYLQWR